MLACPGRRHALRRRQTCPMHPRRWLGQAVLHQPQCSILYRPNRRRLAQRCGQWTRPARGLAATGQAASGGRGHGAHPAPRPVRPCVQARRAAFHHASTALAKRRRPPRCSLRRLSVLNVSHSVESTKGGNGSSTPGRRSGSEERWTMCSGASKPDHSGTTLRICITDRWTPRGPLGPEPCPSSAILGGPSPGRPLHRR